MEGELLGGVEFGGGDCGGGASALRCEWEGAEGNGSGQCVGRGREGVVRVCSLCVIQEEREERGWVEREAVRSGDEPASNERVVHTRETRRRLHPLGRGLARSYCARGSETTAALIGGRGSGADRAHAGGFPIRRWTRVHTSVDHSTGRSDVFHWL